ncbi:uncharacterized protein [Venturia canescens]|uniref:uncharacterized protein isoform X2 n=1 Tax=Venturia canescens TaxID=32260 RepID=UPI001C9C257E|nr:uncharacterized protein LOC122419348 isoform X2 [Venturia canescens]
MKADKNNALFNELSSQKDEGNETEQQREQSTLFSLSCMSQTLSMEIGMLPKISQTIINQVISNTNDDFVQRQKNTKGLHNIDEPINDRQQGSILKASMQIARNATDTGRVASKMNSLHQSKKNFQLGITNEEKYLKKVQFSIAPDLGNTSPNETLKRNINNDVIERVTAIPKKKPKIISQEVLKVPLQHFSFGREHPAIEDSKAPEGDDKFKKSYQEIETCSSIDRSRRKISNVEEQTNFKEGTEKADTTRTGEVLQNPSKLSSVSCKKTVPKRVSTLLMLQRKIDENSIRLLSQVKEMKKLSSLIDELRRNFGSEKTAVAKVSPTKWEPTKKEFVSRCTQTTDSHPMTIDVNDPTRPAVLMTAASSAKLSEKENDSRPNVETKIHKSRHTLFHPVILKNVENTVPKSVSSKCLIISKTLSHHTPIILDHQLSADKTWTPKTVESQQNANSSVQFDPYYNPLRPRRWPRKKNNQSVFRPNNQPKKIEGSYSPLPVVIKKMMSTNVTQ